MTFSPVGISSSDYAYSLPSNTLNKRVSSLDGNTINKGNRDAYYAKKGEPMYMKEMDADEDGIVSLDEFKDYCKDKGISDKEMTKMIQMVNSYRELMSQTGTNDKKTPINNITGDLLEKINSKNNDKIYAVRGDDKYDEAIDTNDDDKITYKEYIDYCVEHVKTNEQKTNTKVEQTEDGGFKTTSYGKAVNAYTRAESESARGMFEYKA